MVGRDGTWTWRGCLVPPIKGLSVLWLTICPLDRRAVSWRSWGMRYTCLCRLLDMTQLSTVGLHWSSNGPARQSEKIRRPLPADSWRLLPNADHDVRDLRNNNWCWMWELSWWLYLKVLGRRLGEHLWRKPARSPIEKKRVITTPSNEYVGIFATNCQIQEQMMIIAKDIVRYCC